MPGRGKPNMLAAVGLNKNKQDQQKCMSLWLKIPRSHFWPTTTYLNQDAPAQNDYGVNVFSEDFAKSQIAEAKKQGAQIIIVSMRWGTEFSSQVNELQRKKMPHFGSARSKPDIRAQPARGATSRKDCRHYSLVFPG